MRGRHRMARTSKTVHVEPGSELDRILKDAGENPIELELYGTRYRVTRIGSESVTLADERDIWNGYDPEKVLHSLHKSRSILHGVDLDQLKRDLTEQRDQDSFGRPA